MGTVPTTCTCITFQQVGKHLENYVHWSVFEYFVPVPLEIRESKLYRSTLRIKLMVEAHDASLPWGCHIDHAFTIRDGCQDSVGRIRLNEVLSIHLFF